jgi:hypothetical protein
MPGALDAYPDRRVLGWIPPFPPAGARASVDRIRGVARHNPMVRARIRFTRPPVRRQGAAYPTPYLSIRCSTLAIAARITMASQLLATVVAVDEG